MCLRVLFVAAIVTAMSIFVLQEANASTKGCIFHYEDGTSECLPMRIGGDCSVTRGRTESRNGKLVVAKEQVLQCQGYDGLGRKLSNASSVGPGCTCGVDLPNRDKHDFFCFPEITDEYECKEHCQNKFGKYLIIDGLDRECKR